MFLIISKNYLEFLCSVLYNSCNDNNFQRMHENHLLKQRLGERKNLYFYLVISIFQYYAYNKKKYFVC